MAYRDPTAQDLRQYERWLAVLETESGFPRPDALRKHLCRARVSSCCECGCNTVTLAYEPDAEPIFATSSRGGLAFDSEFRQLGSDGTLSIMLFSDEAGYVCTVEVIFCNNAFPIPEDLVIEASPFHTYFQSDVRFAV